MVSTKTPGVQLDFNQAGSSIGTVLYTDPLRFLAVVQTTDSKSAEYSFASMIGSKGEGMTFAPPSGKGWRAVITNMGGETFISAFLPPAMEPGGDDNLANNPLFNDQDLTESISGTFNKYRAFAIHESRRKKNYRSGRPYDYIPGDIIFKTLDNAVMAVLNGGVFKAKVSELCQLLLFRENDLARLVARQFELFTDMGVLEFKSGEDGTYFAGRLSSNRKKSPKSRDEEYELSFKLGNVIAGKDKETYFFALEYKTLNKDALLWAMGTDGSVTFSGPKDIWLDVRDEFLITAGRSLGIFSGKSIDMDANERLTMEAGTKCEFDSTGTIVSKATGMSFEAKTEYACMGKLEKMELKVTEDKVMAGKTSGHKEVVQKPHLEDYYNKLCDGLGELLFAPCLGDLAIPVPLATRTSQMKFATSLYFTLKDMSSYTKEFIAT